MLPPGRCHDLLRGPAWMWHQMLPPGQGHDLLRTPVPKWAHLGWFKIAPYKALYYLVKPYKALVGSVAVAVAVDFAVAFAVAVADTFRMGGDHESYKAL